MQNHKADSSALKVKPIVRSTRKRSLKFWRDSNENVPSERQSTKGKWKKKHDGRRKKNVRCKREWSRKEDNNSSCKCNERRKNAWMRSSDNDSSKKCWRKRSGKGWNPKWSSRYTRSRLDHAHRALIRTLRNSKRSWSTTRIWCTKMQLLLRRQRRRRLHGRKQPGRGNSSKNKSSSRCVWLQSALETQTLWGRLLSNKVTTSHQASLCLFCSEA